MIAGLYLLHILANPFHHAGAVGHRHQRKFLSRAIAALHGEEPERRGPRRRGARGELRNGGVSRRELFKRLSKQCNGFSQRDVVYAALNLVLDFDFIESGARAGAPKYMEWYGAFGLMVTLVWLYLEILRLLSKVRSRN